MGKSLPCQSLLVRLKKFFEAQLEKRSMKKKAAQKLKEIRRKDPHIYD